MSEITFKQLVEMEGELLSTLRFYEAEMDEMVGTDHQDPGEPLGGMGLMERRG